MNPTEHGRARPFLIALLALYILFVFYILPGAEVLSTAEIHTEHVSFDVIDSQKAAFHIAGMRVAELGSSAGNCEKGLFTPSLGADVTFGRIGKGPVEITITPDAGRSDAAAGLLDRDESERPAGRQARPGQRFVRPIAMQQDRACLNIGPEAGFPAVRLPIWGRAQIGREFRPAASVSSPEPSLLIDGKLVVSAHRAFATWLFDTSLYEVRSVTLPVASRLEALRPDESGRDAIWWGIASIDPDKTALIVNVATEAPRLALYRPYRTEADIISVSWLTQLTDDPSIIRVQIWLLGVAALAAVAEWAGKHMFDWFDRSDSKY